MRGVGVAAAVTVVVIFAARAPAQLLLVDQARSAQVSASETYTQNGVPGNQMQSDSRAANDFAPFSVSLAADAGLGKSTADQNSQISSLLVSAAGGATATASLSSPQDPTFVGSGTSTGASSFSFTFDLAAPTQVALDAMLVTDGSDAPSGANLASFKFTGPAGAIIDFSTTSPVSRNSIPFTYGDVLAAGRYTLAATATADAPPPAADPNQAASGSEAASFSFTFQVVPEPAWIGIVLLPAGCTRRRRAARSSGASGIAIAKRLSS